MLKRNTQSGREPLCFVFVDRRSAVMSRCLHWEIWDELVSLFLFAHACLKLFSAFLRGKKCWQYVCFESLELIWLYVDNIMILWQDKNHHFFNQSINMQWERVVWERRIFRPSVITLTNSWVHVCIKRLIWTRRPTVENVAKRDYQKVHFVSPLLIVASK